MHRIGADLVADALHGLEVVPAVLCEPIPEFEGVVVSATVAFRAQNCAVLGHPSAPVIGPADYGVVDVELDSLDAALLAKRSSLSEGLGELRVQPALRRGFGRLTWHRRLGVGGRCGSRQCRCAPGAQGRSCGPW